jgi:hypothetical protein
MGPVLAGFAPLAGDPEFLYQPIKTELARSLASGQLPFWSDRFGLGVPLVAESHVAAFYPLNWLFYSLWNVGTAYRIALWLHSIALVVTTFAFARTLGIGRAGSALAAAGFALCGFQAVHAVHEPFYHAMPYLPLCLLLANRYAATGRPAWLAALALAWGTQITLGHFQIQMWTGGLALLVGGWRAVFSGEKPWRPVWIAGLVAGLAWGAAIAGVQLRLTWELTGVAGFIRPPNLLSNYLFPPAHWAQFALPEVFLGRPSGAGDVYWGRHGTTPAEACAYVGVIPLILAFVGLVAAPRDRALAPWRWVTPLSLALATMPGWWPDGFFMFLQLPGLGWFRAPARYTLLTSLGLALLAGRGLDRSITARRFWRGLALAIAVGATAWAWSIHWALGTEFQSGLGADTIGARFEASGLAWVLGLAVIIAWRFGKLGAWAPLAAAVLELGVLVFLGPAPWDWIVRLPEASPVLQRLAKLPDVGLVGSRLLNVPVYAGATAAFPTLGIIPPPPNYLLEPATHAPEENSEIERRWLNRFGVTHGVWPAGGRLVGGIEVLDVIADPALDQLAAGVPSLRARGPWRLVRNHRAFPPAWVARRAHTAPRWGRLYTELSRADLPDEAWFLAGDRPATLPEPTARAARVLSWDRRTAVVEHDGACILILRRTYYPGWTYRVGGGHAERVLKVNGGLQGVPLEGSGTTRVELQYRPPGLAQAAAVSLAALGAALFVTGAACWKALQGHRSVPGS